MARATRVLAATTIAACAAAAWLYIENRSLRDELASRPATPEPTATDAPTDFWATANRARSARSAKISATAAPSLPAAKDGESRGGRRQRRQQQIAAMLGRGSGESPDEYRARIVPLIKAGLAVPRMRVEEMRKDAEAAAHVTPAQSQQLDKAFDKVYGDVVDYANQAVADGQISPYQTNVAGWLQFAGGLGTMLDETNGQISQILSGDQVKALSDSGFEWGEYLGLEVPWESLAAPPPKP